MTQPPQPPQQPPNEPSDTPPGAPNTPPPPAGPPSGPPSGGFGAPQDPPPGGFGQPTPPPADPFGKQPQQPPQPPAAPQDAPAGGYGAPPPPPVGGYPTPPAPQPNGYGYPQAPQQGYGYPQGPGGQPGMPQQGYGYPTQPMHPQYGAPQPGADGGKKFSTQMQIIVAAAVAVVLIIGAGVIYSATGGDDKGGKSEASSSGSNGGEAKGGGLAGGKEKAPASTKSAVAFQLPEPEVGDITTVEGSWLTDKAYVKSGVAEIVGYDRDKGTKLWSVPLPGEVCSASRHMSEDYRTAIVFEETKATKEDKYPSCNQVGVIDMAAGKLLWSKGITSATGGDQQVRFDEITLSGTTVAAGGTSGGAGFNLADGAELWKPKVGADGCYDRGYAGGEALAVVRRCGEIDSPQLAVEALNPKDGAPLSSYKMPAGIDYAAIVSTKPLVVAADVGDTAGDGSGISDFFSIDAATGKLIVRIPADAEQYAASCGSTEVERCQNMAVGNNRLYLPTESHDGTSEYGETNEVVAFDLTTGKLLGSRADAGDRYSLVPLRMDGTNIIAYKEPPYDKGGQIVSIDGETFKQTLLMENPSDEAVREAERRFTTDHSELLYSEGHFFKSKSLISKRSIVDGDDKLYLVVGYRAD